MRTRHPAFWRYTAFQIPGWLLAGGGGWWLHSSLDVPLWAAAGLPAAWVIKDYALYPILRFAYELDQRRPIERLIGAQCTTIEPLEPTGYVRVRGELWRARRAPEDASVGAGDPVEVVGVEGTTLVVRPLAVRTAGTANGRSRESLPARSRSTAS